MIKITCKTQDTLNISELTEFQGDLKQRDENDISKIIKSIKKHGFAFPFFVWNHDGINHVFDGHGRLMALKQLQEKGEEIPELPVVYINAENEAEAKEMLLKLNSNYGHMTVDSVMEFLDGINIDFDDIELPDTTLDFQIDDEDAETEGDDEVPEVQEETVSQLGEIYQLGDSFLMCGDSTNEEDVARLIGDNQINLVLTDAPYGINVVGNNGKVGADNLAKNGVYMKVKGDETTDTAQKNYEIIKKYSNKQILFGGNYFTDFLPFSDSWIIWDKRGDLKSNNFADGEMAWCSFHTPVRIYKQVWSRMIKEGEHEKRVHPTQKPVKMLSEILKDFTNEGDKIFDGFGGSGSTLLACESTNRKCFMIEFEPHYCDVIRRRYTQWAKENNRPLTSGCLE